MKMFLIGIVKGFDLLVFVIILDVGFVLVRFEFVSLYRVISGL